MTQTHNLPTNLDGLYYLASPYSHKDPCIKEMRYVMVCMVSALLYRLGYNLLEPIACSHPVARMFALPTGYEFWKKRDRKMIEVSDGVIVVQMKGWLTSVGVTDEIQYALSIGKPVYYLSMEHVQELLNEEVSKHV